MYSIGQNSIIQTRNPERKHHDNSKPGQLFDFLSGKDGESNNWPGLLDGQDDEDGTDYKAKVLEKKVANAISKGKEDLKLTSSF